MTTAIARLTLDNAPRDMEKLSTIGRYQLTQLADSLGLRDTEEKKSAWIGNTPPQMAADVSTALKLYDTARGKSAPVAAPVERTPVPEEPVQAAPVAAAPVEEAAPVREPVTPSRTRAAKAPSVAAAAPPQQDVTELTKMVSKLAEQLPRLRSPDYGEAIASIATALQGITVQQRVMFTLLTILAEQMITDESLLNILRRAVGETDDTYNMLQKLLAPPATEDDDEGKAQ